MKVTDVITHVLQSKVEQPFTSARGWLYTTRASCIVEIRTDEGITGWGECYGPAMVNKTIIDTQYRARVIGRDPFDVEVVWEDLYNRIKDYGLTGMTIAALSGIDIALWDIKGKILGASVLDLLGGPVRDHLPAIASLHGTKASIDEMAEDIAIHTATGLHGAKVGFGKAGNARLGFDRARDIEFAEKVIAAMGPDKSLMVDLGVKNFWDIATAIDRARAFEELGVAWLEEPLGHDDPEGYRALRAATGIRIAYGEREWNTRGVLRILETGTVDVVGLDPGRVEGITGFRKAADLCALTRRQANAHNFSTAIVGAASQALSWSCPACNVLELQPVYGPAQRDLVDRPIWHKAGNVNLPDGCGLGIEVDEALVRAMRLDV